MPKRGKRGLSEEDRTLWQQVAKTTTPLHRPKQMMPGPALQPKVADIQTGSTPTFQVPSFRVGQTATVAAERVKGTTPHSPIDRKKLVRLKRGKLKPESRIDLHGMTQDVAHQALNRFILQSSDAGLRVVLVITGKGRPRPDFGPIPEQPGILRRNVPIWLRSGLLAPVVLDVVEAHRSHGGGGAFYVYLRARR